MTRFSASKFDLRPASVRLLTHHQYRLLVNLAADSVLRRRMAQQRSNVLRSATPVRMNGVYLGAKR